jgi:hypothetical protein
MSERMFNRVFATARVLESVCQHCLRTVGVSTTPEVLAIVEHAHICPAVRPMAASKAAASS